MKCQNTTFTRFAVLILMVSCWVSPTISAATIDFDSSPSKSTNTYSEYGYLLTNSTSDFDLKPEAFSIDGNGADPDGKTLAINWDHSATTLKRSDGGIFNFTSIDVADQRNTGNIPFEPYEIIFDFKYGNGTTGQQTFNMDKLPGLQTLLINHKGLVEASWHPITDVIQMDNIVVGGTSFVSTPTPAAFWLFGSCLLGLWGLARQRKQSKKADA